MLFRPFLIPAIVAVASACSGGAGGKADPMEKAGTPAKADDKADSPASNEAPLQVAAGDEVDAGPIPPDSDMVFFVVEGALIPLGCFDKDKQTIASGESCLAMVPEGGEVRVGSPSTTAIEKVTGRTVPLCLVGSDKKTALAGTTLGEGATFTFAAWPPATYKAVQVVSGDNSRSGDVSLSDDERKALMAAVIKAGAKADEVKAHQIATLDIDGKGAPEKTYAVFVPDPASSERYRWSGLFLARDGNLNDLVLVSPSKTKEDVLEVKGAVDIDGNGSRELWVRLVFAEGGGDRLYRIDGPKPEPIGAWTCGA